MEPLSPRNQRVQAVRRLARQARDRADRRAFVIEGPTLVAEAIDAGIAVEVVLHVAGAEEAVAAARAAGIDTLAVTEAAMGSMATTVTPQPVLAVAALARTRPLADIVGAEGHVLVLDGVQDPGNAGTILRSAEASGAVAVVFGPRSVDVHNPKVVRASAGSLFRVPVVEPGESSMAEIVAALTQHGRLAYGTAADADHDYDRVELADAAIVMGNEASGLAPETISALHGCVRIPQVGRAESLNVAMAATLLCFEAARQRRTRA